MTIKSNKRGRPAISAPVEYKSQAQTAPKKYIDLLNQTDEEKQTEDNRLKNDEASIALQTTILNAERRVGELKRNLDAAKSAFPYAPDKIYLTKSHLDLAKRELQFYQELREEQF